MRLKNTDPRCEQLKHVLFNGKPLKLCVEADDEEGWAIVAKPRINPGDAVQVLVDENTPGGAISNPKDPSFDWDHEKKTGTVEFVFFGDK